MLGDGSCLRQSKSVVVPLRLLGDGSCMWQSKSVVELSVYTACSFCASRQDASLALFRQNSLLRQKKHSVAHMYIPQAERNSLGVLADLSLSDMADIVKGLGK